MKNLITTLSLAVASTSALAGTTVVVPEPSTLTLLGLAGAMVAILTIRNRK